MSNSLHAPQMPLTLGTFLRQDVAAVRLRTLEATAGTASKALCGATVGFDLWHCGLVSSAYFEVIVNQLYQSHLLADARGLFAR
mgnify:FL=1